MFEFESATIGLSFIIIAWILQLICSWKGERKIKKRFLIFYNLGIAWLVIDSFLIKGYMGTGIFYVIILIFSLAVFTRIGSVKNPVVRKKKR